MLARVWLHRVLSHLHTVVGHVKTQIVPSSDGAQATELTPPDDKKLIRYSSLIGPKVLFILVIAGNAVFSTSLHIEGGEIQAEFLA